MLDLVTDRTADDVREETDKGIYQATDLNRVTEAMEYLNDILTGSGYKTGYKRVYISATRYVWVEEDNPSTEQINAYLNNVRALRSAITVLPSTPRVPQNISFNFIGANNIEKLLVELDILLNLMSKSFRTSDAPNFYAGVEPLPTFGGSVTIRTWADLDALAWTWPVWDTKNWFTLAYEGSD